MPLLPKESTIKTPEQPVSSKCSLLPKKSAIDATPKKVSTVKMKLCKSCGKTYPLSKEYYPIDKSKSNGFKSKCKWCHRGKSKDYYNRVLKKEKAIKKQTTPMEWTELNA